MNITKVKVNYGQLVGLNIHSGNIISEAIPSTRESHRGANVSVLRVYAEKVHHLFNYGMNACDDQELVKTCIEELFSRIRGRPDLFQEGVSIDTNLFMIFRRLLIQHIAPPKISGIRGILFSSEPLGAQGLTSFQREALFLKFRTGLSYREVASVLEITIDQLRAHISKAVDILLHKK